MFALILVTAGLSLSHGVSATNSSTFHHSIRNGREDYKEEAFFNLIDGEDANIDNFPFYAMIVKKSSASLTKKTGERLKLICGSSLIHPNFIITAFHCFKKNRKASAWVAIFHLIDRCQPMGYQMVEFQNLFFHTGSKTSMKEKINDLAIAKLKTPKYDVEPLRLPKHPPIVGRAGIIIGFGRIKLLKVKTDNEVPCILQKTSETVEEWKNCKHSHSKIIGSYCTTSVWKPTTTACRGDSGGPWLVVGSHGYEVQGLSSFGSADCNPINANDFYTNVYQFKPWIQSVIAFGLNDTSSESFTI